MLSQLLISTLFVNYLVIINGLNICGDWTQYKEFKCLKVLERIATEEEALNNCTQIEKSSTLITINSKEEQEFLNKLLPKYNNITNNVWIGLKYNVKDKNYQWMDFSNTSFTNWVSDAVKDDPCVRMSLDKAVGKWTDMSCRKPGLIVCQKKPEFDLNVLKNILEAQESQIDKQQGDIQNVQGDVQKAQNETKLIKSEIEKHEGEIQKIQGEMGKTQNETQKSQSEIEKQQGELLKIQNEMQKAKGEIPKTQAELEKVHGEILKAEGEIEKQKTEVKGQKIEIAKQQVQINSMIPKEFIYSQLPKQNSPEQLWPNVKWIEVTDQFAELFFRAEGGAAAEFGQTQQEDHSWISNISAHSFETTVIRPLDYVNYTLSPGNGVKVGPGWCIDYIDFYTTLAENRPINTAVKLWKRR